MLCMWLLLVTSYCFLLLKICYQFHAIILVHRFILKLSQTRDTESRTLDYQFISCPTFLPAWGRGRNLCSMPPIPLKLFPESVTPLEQHFRGHVTLQQEGKAWKSCFCAWKSFHLQQFYRGSKPSTGLIHFCILLTSHHSWLLWSLCSAQLYKEAWKSSLKRLFPECHWASRMAGNGNHTVFPGSQLSNEVHVPGFSPGTKN